MTTLNTCSIKYVCFVENCAATFENENEIKFHLRKIHFLKAIDHYECCVAYCFKKFSAFKNFSEHLKSHNTKNVEVTNPTAATSMELEDHMVAPNMSGIEVDVMPSTSSDIQNSLKRFEGSIQGENNFEGNLVFTTKYISKNNITRSDAQNLKTDIHTYITSHIGNMIKFNILEKMKSNSISNKEIISSLEEILEICQEPFKDIDSEYKYFKFLEANDLFRKPHDFTFNESIAPKIVNYQNTFSETSSHISIQDLKFQFRKFFEIPGILQETLEHMRDLDKSDEIENFVNGSLFKTVKSTYAPDDLVIPFFLYWDDFEINNPLGLFK